MQIYTSSNFITESFFKHLASLTFILVLSHDFEELWTSWCGVCKKKYIYHTLSYIILININIIGICIIMRDVYLFFNWIFIYMPLY